MSYRKVLVIATAVILLFTFGQVVTFGPLEHTHLQIRDIFYRMRGPVPPNPEVTIIAIDDKSIAQYGRWPWPRVYIAALVHRLAKAGLRSK